jgi:hypothetical protein
MREICVSGLAYEVAIALCRNIAGFGVVPEASKAACKNGSHLIFAKACGRVVQPRGSWRLSWLRPLLHCPAQLSHEHACHAINLLRLETNEVHGIVCLHQDPGKVRYLD